MFLECKYRAVFALFTSEVGRSLRGTDTTSSGLTAVFPNALHHTGRNLTEDKLFTVSPKIRHYAENGLLKIIIKKTIVIIIIKNERLVVHTGDSIAGAAESSVDHMCRSPTSGFVFP